VQQRNRRKLTLWTTESSLAIYADEGRHERIDELVSVASLSRSSENEEILIEQSDFWYPYKSTGLVEVTITMSMGCRCA
jgi:hypothetical protein